MHGDAGVGLLTVRGREPGGGGAAGERGAAVVEFVLVSVLLVGLFLGVLQVGLVLHMRNVVVASAAAAAREAANADRDCADGAVLARAAVAQALGTGVADRLAFEPGAAGCEQAVADGLVLSAVRVRGELPLVLLPGLAVGVDATAHAIEEGQ